MSAAHAGDGTLATESAQTPKRQWFGGCWIRCMCGWSRGVKNMGHGFVEIERHWAEAHGIVREMFLGEWKEVANEVHMARTKVAENQVVLPFS